MKSEKKKAEPKDYTSVTIEVPVALDFTQVVNDMRKIYKKSTKQFTNTDGLKELIATWRKEVMK